jgi:hypothetical protein
VGLEWILQDYISHDVALVLQFSAVSGVARMAIGRDLPTLCLGGEPELEGCLSFEAKGFFETASETLERPVAQALARIVALKAIFRRLSEVAAVCELEICGNDEGIWFVQARADEAWKEAKRRTWS